MIAKKDKTKSMKPTAKKGATVPKVKAMKPEVKKYPKKSPKPVKAEDVVKKSPKAVKAEPIKASATPITPEVKMPKSGTYQNWNQDTYFKVAAKSVSNYVDHDSDIPDVEFGLVGIGNSFSYYSSASVPPVSLWEVTFGQLDLMGYFFTHFKGYVRVACKVGEKTMMVVHTFYPKPEDKATDPHAVNKPYKADLKRGSVVFPIGVQHEFIPEFDLPIEMQVFKGVKFIVKDLSVAGTIQSLSRPTLAQTLESVKRYGELYKTSAKFKGVRIEASIEGGKSGVLVATYRKINANTWRLVNAAPFYQILRELAASILSEAPIQ